MSELFRPRRRPLLRLTLTLGACTIVIGATAIVVWLRTNVVPPDCRDPATLALVRRSLTGRFALPASVTIENIETLAGGYVAFRFACEADLRGFDPKDLTPGSPVPGSVSCQPAEGRRSASRSDGQYPTVAEARARAVGVNERRDLIAASAGRSN